MSTQKLIYGSIIQESQNMEIPQMFINESIGKQMCYIHTMIYYLAIKRGEVLIHATAEVNFKTLC